MRGALQFTCWRPPRHLPVHSDSSASVETIAFSPALAGVHVVG